MADSVWKRPGLEECVWDVGKTMSAFRRKSIHHPGLAHLTEARVLEGLLDLTAHPSCHTDGEIEAQEGRDLPRVLCLVAEPTWGPGALGFQLSSAPSQEVTAAFRERERTGWP